jgi:hypothetical protein
MANKDTVLAVISDMQVGSTLALCPERWNLLEGGTFFASPAQKILYREWIHSAEVLKDMLKDGRNRKRLVVILNGEPIDNYHHGTSQLITKVRQEQIDMSISLLDKWLNIVDFQPKRGDCMYLIRGTSAHERGEHIEQIGRDIVGVVPIRKDSSKLLKDGRYHHQKLRLAINGELFHITHHGFNRGSRAWTTENSITYALKSMYFTAKDYGYAIPGYVIRSHNHVYTRGIYPGKDKIMWGCITPCWQLKTDFGNQVAGNEDINTIGNIYFDITQNGAVKPVPEILEIEDTPIIEL